jgi:hypothetical protein
MDKHVFSRNLETVKRRKILLIRVSLSLLFLILVTSMWMAKAHPHDAVRSTFKTVSLLGFMAVVYLCVASIQRLAQRLGLLCPHCSRGLSGLQGQQALASETCGHCGQRIF